jgi:hypothetical protein
MDRSGPGCARLRGQQEQGVGAGWVTTERARQTRVGTKKLHVGPCGKVTHEGGSWLHTCMYELCHPAQSWQSQLDSQLLALEPPGLPGSGALQEVGTQGPFLLLKVNVDRPQSSMLSTFQDQEKSPTTSL